MRSALGAQLLRRNTLELFASPASPFHGLELDAFSTPARNISTARWTHRWRVYWPRTISYLFNPTTGRPQKPFLVRDNMEPWLQISRGIDAWFQAKREEYGYQQDAVGIFQPHMVNSFGRRLPVLPGDKQSPWSIRAGPIYERLADLVYRPQGFDARAVRLAKPYFAAMVNGNCRDGTKHTEGTLIREIFTYALAKYKPVHNIGMCPHGEAGAVRAGITEQRRSQLRRQYAGTSTIDIFRDHKFAVVFENSNTLGYLTEKLVNGYALNLGADLLWRRRGDGSRDAQHGRVGCRSVLLRSPAPIRFWDRRDLSGRTRAPCDPQTQPAMAPSAPT